MPPLPWELNLQPQTPETITVQLNYDDLEGTLAATVTNTGDTPFAGPVTVAATLDLPAVSGIAWASSGIEDLEELESLEAEDALLVLLPIRAAQGITLRGPATFTIDVSEEEVLTRLAIAWPLNAPLAPAATVALPAIEIAEHPTLDFALATLSLPPETGFAPAAVSTPIEALVATALGLPRTVAVPATASDNEARALATAATIAGLPLTFEGAVPDGLGLLATPPPPGTLPPPVPLDATSSPMPLAWRVDLEEDDDDDDDDDEGSLDEDAYEDESESDGPALIAIFNTTAEGTWLVPNEFVEPGETAFDPLKGTILDRGDVFLEAGKAAIWQVGASGSDPRLFGDTGSLTFEEISQRLVSGRLQLTNTSDAPRIVAVDIRGRKEAARLEPGQARWFD